MDNFSFGVITGIGLGLIGSYILRKNFLCSSKITKYSMSDALDTVKSLTKSSKLILVVRNDLKMGKGKIAAQCSHASVMAYCKAKKYTPTYLKQWKSTGQMKVVVKIDNEKEMLDLKKKAEKEGLCTSLVCDAGHTQVDPNTYTVLAIGPANSAKLNELTGHLKLL